MMNLKSYDTSLLKIQQARNVIFDMDGTLSNSGIFTVSACHKVSRQMGLPLPDPETIVRLIGYPVSEYYGMLLPHLDAKTVEEYGQRAEAQAVEDMLELGAGILFPGTREMLECLKSKGYGIYLASTGDTPYIQGCLQASGLGPFFNYVGCNQPRKEEMVKSICAMDSGGFIMVGDKILDCQAAAYAEIPSVCVLYGFGTPEEQRQFDACIRRPLDLLDLLHIA